LSSEKASTPNAWEAKFKELEEYKERHGDVDVPQKYPPNRSLVRSTNA